MNNRLSNALYSYLMFDRIAQFEFDASQVINLSWIHKTNNIDSGQREFSNLLDLAVFLKSRVIAIIFEELSDGDSIECEYEYYSSNFPYEEGRTLTIDVNRNAEGIWIKNIRDSHISGIANQLNYPHLIV